MNEFEKAVNEIEKDVEDENLENENVIEFLRNSKVATVTFTQARYISRIRKLKEKFPDKIEICHEAPGIIVAHIPTSAVKLNLVTPREMTEEERAAARERLLKYRRKKEEEGAREEETEDDLDLDLDLDFNLGEEEEE